MKTLFHLPYRLALPAMMMLILLCLLEADERYVDPLPRHHVELPWMPHAAAAEVTRYLGRDITLRRLGGNARGRLTNCLIGREH